MATVVFFYKRKLIFILALHIELPNQKSPKSTTCRANVSLNFFGRYIESLLNLLMIAKKMQLQGDATLAFPLFTHLINDPH